jgi:hypothetical protein
MGMLRMLVWLFGPEDSSRMETAAFHGVGGLRRVAAGLVRTGAVWGMAVAQG